MNAMNITRFSGLRFIARQQNVSTTLYNGLKTNCNGNVRLFKHNNDYNQQLRFVSTCEVKSIQKEESLIKKVLNKIPFLRINRIRIRAAAYILYEGIADKINYIDIIEEFDLPDTFYSWFVITELHIWMLSVRAMADGADGRHLRNYIVEALWSDVAQRAKKLGPGSTAAMREEIYKLSEQLQAAFIAYDEGLQTTDMVLAGALWRRLYQMETVNSHHLEELVKYVRKQISLLDNVSSEQLFKDKYISWEPLK